METKNVAIVGIENSHAEEIIRYLNVERPVDVPVRVVALVAGEDDRTRELAELGGIEQIVAESGDLLGSIDALIVTSRDGALHRRTPCRSSRRERRSGSTSRWRRASPMRRRSSRRPSVAARCSPRRRRCAGWPTPTRSPRASDRSASCRRSL